MAGAADKAGIAAPGGRLAFINGRGLQIVHLSPLHQRSCQARLEPGSAGLMGGNFLRVYREA
jgi:hypothetical protein